MGRKPACLHRQHLDACSVLQRSRSESHRERPAIAEATARIATEGCGPNCCTAADAAELTNHTLFSRETVGTRAERFACERILRTSAHSLRPPRPWGLGTSLGCGMAPLAIP